MSRSSSSGLLGAASLALLVVNTILWCVPFYVVGVARLLLPIEAWQKACALALTRLAEGWVRCNNLLLDCVHEIEWDVRIEGHPRRNAWYLMICNHQTWTDIPILQRAFVGRAPFIKFFLKQELIWVPLLGPAWWFLDFPFMKRYSRAAIEKRPELRGRDLETTRRACAKFRHAPVSILNFLEGTRLTADKQAAQESPYRHLLRPRAGGIAFVLEAMGDTLESLIDVTIVYPDGVPDFWDFLSGRFERVIVDARERVIPADLLGGDYLGDAGFRARFQRWIDDLWKEKDRRIDELLRGGQGRPDPLPQVSSAQEPAASIAPMST